MSARRGKSRRKKFGLVRVASWFVFLFVLVSVFTAYSANQSKISAKRSELDNLNGQIEQQQAENQEMERILSGDPDEIMEWIARDSYGYAAPNERIFVDRFGN